jgi:peptide chain release factor 3
LDIKIVLKNSYACARERWLKADDAKVLDHFATANHDAIAEDVNGDHVFLARNAFNLDYTGQQNREIGFTEVKDVHAERV